MMKQPHIGKIVAWYNAGCRDNGMNPAIVTAVGNGVIRCNVFQPGSSTCRATNWLRHIDDPWNDSHRVARDDHGAWDWLEEDKASVAIDMAMDAMDERDATGGGLLAQLEKLNATATQTSLTEIPWNEDGKDSLPEIGRAARKKAKATS